MEIPLNQELQPKVIGVSFNTQGGALSGAVWAWQEPRQYGKYSVVKTFGQFVTSVDFLGIDGIE
jgi:hypothetical protein